MQAIEVAKRAGMRLILAAAENDDYRDTIASHVDGTQLIMRASRLLSQSEVVRGARRDHPVQIREPFGLILAEVIPAARPSPRSIAARCEVVDDGAQASSSRAWCPPGLPRVFALIDGAS